VENALCDARRSLQRGDPAAALEPLQRAEQIQPNRADVQYLLAVANRRVGRLEVFRGHLLRARNLGSGADDVQRQEWLASAQSGNVEEVGGQLQALIDSGVPDDVAEEIYEALIRGHLAAIRFREAWLGLELWIQWRPQAPQARLMRASLYEEMGDLTSAMGDYRAAVEQIPRSTSARIHLAQGLLSQGQIEGAQEQLDACLALNPNDADALAGEARCARARHEDDQARAWMDAALAQDVPGKKRADFLSELGQWQLDDGKAVQAVNTLAQAAALAPAEAPIHHRLASALARAGQPQRAKEHEDRAQQLRGKQDRLITIRRMILDKPGDAELRYEAGTILLGEGFLSDGLAWLSAALVCDPHHRKTHQRLADYYAQAGNPQLAAHHRLLAASVPAAGQGTKPN